VFGGQVSVAMHVVDRLEKADAMEIGGNDRRQEYTLNPKSCGDWRKWQMAGMGSMDRSSAVVLPACFLLVRR
jgi:hypothetical protein